MRTRRSLLLGLVLVFGALFTTPLRGLPNVAAQQPTPVVTVLPTVTPPQPTPVPTTTAPPLTPTPTNPDLVGIGWFKGYVDRFGWLGAIFILIFLLAVTGIGQGLVELVKNLVPKMFEQLVALLATLFGGNRKNQALKAYLLWLRDEFLVIPQIPLDTKGQQLQLSDVYVALRVVEREQMEIFQGYTVGEHGDGGEYRARRDAFGALERSQPVYRLLSDPDCLPKQEAKGKAAQRKGAIRPGDTSAEPPLTPMTTRRLLLVGDAGSGKTTTLHYGALLLAEDYLNRTSQRARTMLGVHCHERLLPFYVKLTLVMTYITENNPSQLANAPAQLLITWLDIDIPRQLNRPDFPPHFSAERLTKGGGLVLFDGLDETGDERERSYMKQLIANVVQAYPKNRYIVATRPFAGVAVGLHDFKERRLSPLNAEEIQTLLRQWFNAAQKAEAGQRRPRRSAAQEYDELWRKLQASPRLFDMATNPLLLTSMALLVYGGDPLPPERAKIYNRLVSLTIERWRRAQLDFGLLDNTNAPKEGLYIDGIEDVRRRLQKLAAWMLQNQRREIQLRDAQEQLAPVYKENRGWNSEISRNHIQALLDQLSLHSGIIQQRDQGYSFIHFTLQEYLAARDYDEDDNLDGLFAQWRAPRWRETVLLAIGHWATSGRPKSAKEFLKQLLATNETDALFLAAEALDEANARNVTELVPTLNDTLTRLRALAFTPANCPDPRQRHRAAQLLDQLGADERDALNPAHPSYWADRIAPGPFAMGAENERFPYTIRQPYALARFPVTNRQYLAFLESLMATGDEGRKQAEPHRPPFWPGLRYGLGEGNQPVVGVSWSDATAFAAWAHQTWLSDTQRTTGEAIRLPTEPEWERAAAYPPQLSSSSLAPRPYPWGAWPNLTATANDSIKALIPANTEESDIKTASVVGIFPHGAAACGAEELAGNVWEWCSTEYLQYPLPEALTVETVYTKNKWYTVRGGSFYQESDTARCVSRRRTSDVSNYDNYGFRLARLFSL